MLLCFFYPNQRPHCVKVMLKHSTLVTGPRSDFGHLGHYKN